MGSLPACVLLDSTTSPKVHRLFALLGLCAAAMFITRDGHGPGLLTGALLGAVMTRSQQKNAGRPAN
jgi:hypothetical protein